jgi:nucleotide-binding universal stress UspA family protein
MTDAQRILICHDGSEGAEHALAEAARLFPAANATITHVWRPPLPYGGVGYGGQIILPAEVQRDIEAKLMAGVEEVTTQAAARAASAGLSAEVDTRETTGPVWRELLAAADEIEAGVIIAGSRGFGEIRGFVLGSTSQALLHHSRRPVLIVPAPEARS